MKKTVQTTAWQFSKQLLAIACFLVIGMVQVAAQNATANYITTLKVTSISWSGIDYGSLLDDEVDVPLIGQTGSPEFFFTANGASFYTGDDVNATGNLGGLNSPIWSSVVPVGANLGAIGPVNITFQAYEFDTASDNDAVVLTTSGVDWSANVDTDPNNGQFITGNYAVAPAVFAAPGGGTYTFNLSVTVVAAAPAINTCLLSVTPTGNTVSYACLSDAAANTSVSIGGGTAPYKILGSGIYDAVTGDPFDFGVDPFGLTVGAGTFEFQVREGQPWTVIVQDAVGCIVAQEGVFDLPNPMFNTPATMCTSDPVINIFENSIFDPAGDILNGQFFFSVAGGVDNGDGFSATFDPFIAGPGQHFIAYCVQAQGGGGPGFGPGNYEDGCQICYEQTIYVYPSFDGYDGAGNLVTEIGLNTGGSPEADAALQTNVCVGHANMSLGLTNFDDFDALFASLELAFDPNGQIDETDFFITWAGNGVTDNADGTATFSPAALGPVPPGGIATSIQVTVGYPSCPTVYVVVMNVMPNFNATVNDVATCATAGDSYDLTGAFGANTTAGGYFYTVGAGGALTAVTSGTLSEAANAGTSVTILYSNTAGLTNQSQCNADDCINCDTAVITFSGLTVDCSFALEDGPEVCRGTTPLVDTVVDPIITNSPVTGIQATAVGNNVIPKDLTTTASLGTIDPYGFINSIEVEINYTGLNGNTQGDHNGYSVTMPGGVTFVAADVPVGQTSNYTVTYTNGTAAWNTDIPTPNNDTFNDHTITWEQIQAAYANANLNINDVFTGTNAPGLVGTCQENEFTFDLETNANNAAISITVTPSYVEPAGFVTAFIWSTGTQLPAEAITFDNVTGEYYLNTLFTDANGSAWDLSTYLDIELVHTTYSCSAQLPDGTLCTQSCTEVIKVLPALITDIANLTACINDGAIDLEQMFIQGTATGTDGINITGGTTQGGVFTATNGTVNGTYFTPTAGATSSTITYTIGAGTGADGCDPLPSTATLTLETAADPEFNYPTTVCVGAIPDLPAAAAGTTSGLQVFDPQGNNISHAAFQAATVGGLYTIEQTTGPAGCQEEYTHSVLVVESPVAVSANATVCRNQAVVELTQFVAGSTMGGNFTGTGVAGEVLILGTLNSSTITYTVGSNGCTATTTFTITIVDQPNAAFDVIDQICEGTTVNLYDYTLQDNGSFTDNGVAVPNPAAWTATGEGLHNLVYTIGAGTSCTATDQENVYVIGDQTVTAEYGFLCQSTTDFTIDLTDQLTDGSNAANGGTFTMRQMPAFISEIEYAGGPTIDGRDFIEVTAPAGTNLNEYALVFYKRMGYTVGGSNNAVNSGAVYGVIDMADLQPNQTVGATTPNGTIVDSEVTGLNGISYGSVGVKYFDATPNNPGNDVAPIGQTITGIADGPAAVALVYKGSATTLEDLDIRLGNDDVVQFIGYGTSLTNTNAGIFSACDGPARSLVSVDINTVDAAGRSTQFTNTCWVNPNVDDSEVDYATAPAPNVTSTGAGIPAYATVGDLTSAGSLNVGLRGDTAGNEGYLSGRGHGDELYFDYVAPNGDVLHLDRLCQVLFVGGQIVNTADYVNPSNGDTNGDGTVDNNDDDEVEFTCETMTYTIPFGYQLLPGAPGSTQCGSNQAIFYLTVLMDGEENWNNYSISNPEGVLKEAVCDYSENNLNTYIDDIVHWISPIKRTGSFDTTATYTFEENIKDPLITELKYKDYGYTGPAADDHCVVYNYVDDNNTPFNQQDDDYTNARFCDGIEISAPEGTELSCYSLVFYSDDNILPQTPANGAGFDVTYINAMGVPAKTLIANGRYMQLYGLIDDDQTNAYPGGTIMTVPTFGLDIWNNYPYYAGANPLDASNQYGQAGAPAESGLYIDVNDNAAYDAGDVAVAGPTGFAGYNGASFPWERGTECNKNGVGARWFPILDVPGNGTEEIGGVGLINNCTGKLVDFISWGGELCVETKEDCSVAGPFEQLSSVEIDTVQSTLCCDLRTLQLVSASVADELTGSTCPSANADANGNVWVQVYNGGEYTIPGCGIYTADAEEFYEFSNSVGYYNCDLLEEAVIADPQAFTLDLADIDVSDNYIVTNHTIEVTIGSVQENYFQLYTYGISTGACGNLNSNDGLPGNVNIIPTNNPAMDNSVDLDENGNTNLITVVPGLTCGVPTHDNAIISQPAVGTNGLLNSLEEPWDTNPDNVAAAPGTASYAYWDYNNPGVVNYWPNSGPTQYHNNPWSNGNQPSPIYMGSTIDNYGYPIYNGWGDNTPCMACGTDPNACIADGEYAPVMYNANGSHTFNGSYNATGNPVGPGQLEFDFQDGQGPLNIEGGCFQSYCTSLAKTTYTVSDLTAYLYNGNTIPGYEDASSDSCRSLVFSNDDVRVRIRVKFDYEQCLPVGKFAGSDVSLNDEDDDMPYWVFAPQGLAETSPVSITYDVTNAHEIETDDATDDLACLDDDNDNMRTQDIEVLPAGDASLNTNPANDIDNDGIINSTDLDDDNDGLQDDAGDAVSNLGGLDFDNDGIINSTDPDDDNDGLVDNAPGDTTVAFDSDGDGMVDSVDTDDDNDGLSDNIDTNNDTDGDGLANSSDPDDDNDGVLDAADSDDDNDNIPDMLDIDQDNDGLTDIADPDDDNDGLLDADDNDTDNDGISDANDTDDDNDGLSEVVDNEDYDTDNDGIPDNDKDADGLPDTSPADANNDGIVDNTSTSNTPTYVDCATVDCDDDNDGISDFADPDDDNDGIKDSADSSISPISPNASNTVSTCTNSPALNLSNYVTGTTGGTWTANGGNLNGNSFSSSTAGTFTLTYTVGGGDCQDAASLTVTVGQSGSINTAGLPTSVCAGTAVLLPAGTWSGDGVTGDTFSSNTAGTYTLTGTAGSGACATTATVSITVVPALSVAVTQDCNGEQAVVTLTVSGGVGPYNVNGTGIAGSSTSFTVPSDSFFQYNVDDASACAGVSVNGIAATCIAPCIADAGTLALLTGIVDGKICGNSVIVVEATGFADCATQTYALTDAAGNIVAVSASGQFNLATLQGADYTAWGVNFTEGTVVPTTVAEITGNLGDDLDVTNPITITVVPEIEITLAAICDPNSGGYFLQATVSGGDPSINGFGSYTCNLASALVSGSFSNISGIPSPINVVLGNGNATTSFAAGSSVAVSFGDGSLCEASASFIFPDVACGIGAAPNNAFTLVDQPIVIDVLDNDTGNLTVIAVTNPANGTATINPDGTITYTPDAGFSGQDVFVYQAISSNGTPVTSTVTVVVQGSSVAALSADWTRDCSDVATTSQYGVSVFIQGGVAPYTVAGTYNETNINDGNAFFSVPDGSGFQVVVTDANGNQFTIDESDIIPCSKVDAELVFSGEVKADGNLLKWTTFSEVNNDYFTLEFSRDGISYETIAIVDGAGNSTTNKNYNFTHKNVPNGVGYYRISTTDFDGTSVIKEVITLTRGEVKFGIVSLYPVPATTNLTVSFETAAAATVKASIFNVAGQLAIAKDVTAIAGTNTPTFNVTALPAGTYYISLNDGTNIATTKFVKQ